MAAVRVTTTEGINPRTDRGYCACGGPATADTRGRAGTDYWATCHACGREWRIGATRRLATINADIEAGVYVRPMMRADGV